MKPKIWWEHSESVHTSPTGAPHSEVYWKLAERCEKCVYPYLKHMSASVHSKIMLLHKSIGKTSLLGYFLTGLQHKQIQQQKLKKCMTCQKYTWNRVWLATYFTTLKHT